MSDTAAMPETTSAKLNDIETMKTRKLENSNLEVGGRRAVAHDWRPQ